MKYPVQHTGISSHLGAKLRDWAARQAGAGCYSWAALSSNDSKTPVEKEINNILSTALGPLIQNMVLNLEYKL